VAAVTNICTGLCKLLPASIVVTHYDYSTRLSALGDGVEKHGGLCATKADACFKCASCGHWRLSARIAPDSELRHHQIQLVAADTTV